MPAVVQHLRPPPVPAREQRSGLLLSTLLNVEGGDVVPNPFW